MDSYAVGDYYEARQYQPPTIEKPQLYAHLMPALVWFKLKESGIREGKMSGRGFKKIMLTIQQLTKVRVLAPDYEAKERIPNFGFN